MKCNKNCVHIIVWTLTEITRKSWSFKYLFRFWFGKIISFSVWSLAQSIEVKKPRLSVYRHGDVFCYWLFFRISKVPPPKF